MMYSRVLNRRGVLISGGVPKNRRFNRPKTKIYITEVDIFSEKLISVPPRLLSTRE